jgi:L-rhamnose mutarotase
LSLKNNQLYGNALKTGDRMKRIAMLLKIKPGKKDDYISIHKNVWPEIVQALKESHITNNSTFVNNELLFMYLEYNGIDFAADWKKYGENQKVKEWFAILKNCVEPYEKPMPPTIWSVLEETFHLD